MASPSIEELLEIRGAQKLNQLRPHFASLLDALLNPEYWENAKSSQIIPVVASLVRDNAVLQAHTEDFFATISKLLECYNTQTSPQRKKAIDNIITTLYNSAQIFLNTSEKTVLHHLKIFLTSMIQEANFRWAAYGLVTPVLMSHLESFVPYAPLFLQVMRSFPETVSVISDFYKLCPEVLENNVPILMEIFKANPACQLSVIALLDEIASKKPTLVVDQVPDLITHGASETVRQEATTLETKLTKKGS